MRHGYTNSTERAGDTVVKRYAGPDSLRRAARESQSLTALTGLLPVPEVVDTSPDSLTTRFVQGQHGQDLLDAGFAHDVLAECGRVLRELHALDPRALGFGETGGVILHGDFGPNNVLLTTDPMRVAAVVDWEFSGVGPPITDVAWCEWIVRMHHPAAVGHLPAFFEAYGERPPWSMRQAEMLRRCESLADFSRRWDGAHPGISLWHARRDRTATWCALPDDAG